MTATGSIICGVDGSESAKGAARFASTLSARLGLPLLFVRVIEGAAGGESAGVLAERLRQLRKSEPQLDGGAAWLVDTGHPADRLVAVAADRDASLIVVGSHGPRASLLGSISAEVSRRALCPVVIVPPGADASVDGHHGGGIAHLGLGSTTERRARTTNHHDTRDFAGGIVRFSLGSRRGAS